MKNRHFLSFFDINFISYVCVFLFFLFNSAVCAVAVPLLFRWCFPIPYKSKTSYMYVCTYVHKNMYVHTCTYSRSIKKCTDTFFDSYCACMHMHHMHMPTVVLDICPEVERLLQSPSGCNHRRHSTHSFSLLMLLFCMIDLQSLGGVRH